MLKINHVNYIIIDIYILEIAVDNLPLEPGPVKVEFSQTEYLNTLSHLKHGRIHWISI